MSNNRLNTVIENMKNTIAGKEEYLAYLSSIRNNTSSPPIQQSAIHATAKFLEINIDELKRILVDLEAAAKEIS